MTQKAAVSLHFGSGTAAFLRIRGAYRDRTKHTFYYECSKEVCHLAWQNNSVSLCGEVTGAASPNHRSRGVSYYSVPFRTRRLSGTEDRLNLILPEGLLGYLPEIGQRASLCGELRSYHDRSGGGSRLKLFVFAQEFFPAEAADRNEVNVSGVLCRAPTWRRTPMGREICDLMLAVPRRYGRADYLPCIAWGRNAEEAAEWEQNRPVRLTGRFQSRKYVKVLPEGSVERTAYEVSVTSFLSPDAAPSQP